MFDIVIIGAGIIGTMLARQLSFYHLKTAVVERNSDVADGTSMANSAIVHTGYDPEDGTLKAQLNAEGARMYPSLLQQLHCHHKNTGAFIAACGEKEEEHLTILRQRADQRGIPYRILDGDQARKEEPHLSDAVTKVIDFYTTEVIYPWEAALRCMENAVNNGTKLYLNTEVTGIEKTDTGYRIISNDMTLDTAMVINCAGVNAPLIHDMIDSHRDYEIIPRKGEYYVLDHDCQPVRHIIFPVPGPAGKGVLAVPTVYGNTLIGPNALECDRDDVSTTSQGLQAVRQAITKTLKDIPMSHNIRTFAGIRATSSRHDFIIEEVRSAPGFIDVAGIESPGLASAPAIVSKIVHDFVEPYLHPHMNESASHTVEPPVIMNELSMEQQNEMIRRNPLYGKIVCRCENVSEQEIIDCMHRPVPATTIKGVKKRVRPGMGRCQGGFCQPYVLRILAQQNGKKKTEICMDEPGSCILVKENRL